MKFEKRENKKEYILRIIGEKPHETRIRKSTWRAFSIGSIRTFYAFVGGLLAAVVGHTAGLISINAINRDAGVFQLATSLIFCVFIYLIIAEWCSEQAKEKSE